MTIKILPLSQLAEDQLNTRSAFDCGDAELNLYLSQIASQHDKKNITRTFCLIRGDEIVAYYSLANAEVDVREVNEEVVRRFRLPKHRLPVVRLCRLAVDKRRQGQGDGSRLLIDAMSKAVAVSQASGCVGLVADAKHARAAQFYEQFGFHKAPENPLVLLMPLKTIEDLLLGLH